MDSTPQPVAPSEATANLNEQVARSLPFDDDPFAAAASRGLIHAVDGLRVPQEGKASWAMEPYAFLDGERPDSVHPSLWRIAKLNRMPGLFEVCEGIYQVRGYDLSNMTVIVGESGYIIVDPLTTVETATAATELVVEQLGAKPLTGMIFTHSHTDHFGGVRGVFDVLGIEDPQSIPIVAPHRFMEETVSENVYAGNAMLRRAMYMFGPVLPRGERGQVSAGLGVTVAGGATSLAVPNHSIADSGTTLMIDGLEFVFQYTPDTEAPAEMIFHIPARRALCMAEIVSHVMHNLYTLRGAQVRDALTWSKCLYEAVARFGADTDVMFISHHWPVWGRDDVTEFIRMQADMYKYLHDQTLRLANHGLVSDEISEVIEMPTALAHFWPNRGLYGSVSHNARAVYQRYLGFFDGNPARLHRHTPTGLGQRYVAAIGGIDAVIKEAQTAYDAADYRWATELLSHVLAVDPEHEAARALQAATFDQLGYQSESGPWRNIYLGGAWELRSGTPRTSQEARPRVQNELRMTMTVEMILDFAAIRLNGPKAADERRNFALTITDEDRVFDVHLRYGVLSFTETAAPDAPAISLTRHALLRVIEGFSTIEDEVAAGEATDDGGGDVLTVILGLLDSFDPRFPIVTGRPDELG